MKKLRRAQERLEIRIELWQETMKLVSTTKYSRGFKMPGSQNPKKR